MLTDKDYLKFRKIIREEVQAESETTKNELRGEIRMTRILIMKELDGLKSRVKNVEIKISKIQKDLKTIANFLDKQHLQLVKKVKKLEEHLGFTN